MELEENSGNFHPEPCLLNFGGLKVPEIVFLVKMTPACLSLQCDAETSSVRSGSDQRLSSGISLFPVQVVPPARRRPLTRDGTFAASAVVWILLLDFAGQRSRKFLDSSLNQVSGPTKHGTSPGV